MNTPLLVARRAASSSVCLSCRRSIFRRFSSAGSRVAFPEFQSYRLNNNPQPPSSPRGAGGPDTSITHPVPVDSPPLPRLHETRPPPNSNAQLSSSTSSLREKVAQQSKPEFAAQPTSASEQPQQQQKQKQEAEQSTTSAQSTATSSSATTTTPPKARPRSKLRAPRKAAMKLTPSAVEQLRALLDQPEPKLIKVGVRNRGCSGLAYHLEYVDKAGAFDETVEQDGVKVLIDSKALFSIIGSEMDWVEDKLNQRFVFRNPNISEFGPRDLHRPTFLMSLAC